MPGRSDAKVKSWQRSAAEILPDIIEVEKIN